MKKWFPLLVAMLILPAGLAGCANEGHLPANTANAHEHDHEHEHEHHQYEPAATPSEEDDEDDTVDAPAHTLSGSVNDRMELVIETTLSFSEENYGRVHQEGEGHVHLYINGRLVGPLKHAGPHDIARHLQEGDNAIKLALASNSHNEAAYNTKYEFTVSIDNPAGETGE